MTVESVDQAIDVTIKLLNSIEVPVSMIRTVGVKISVAVSNLEKINERIRNFTAEKPEEADEPEGESKEEPA